MQRRQFLAASAGVLLTGLPTHAATRPKRIAFLGTVVREHSHAQHFLDRLTQGQNWGGRWLAPRVEVASVYIDQFPEGDLGRQRIAKHQLKQHGTIAEALCLGGSSLAVDGVVIIAEHGKYPRNDKGQTRYPRYDWFKQVVNVFEASGRSVPVFNDKHLSTTWDECAEMVADSERLGFPFLAGSSLPVTWRLPSIDVPYGAPMTESVCVAYGGVDSYDIHALETAQCMSERRQGGEVGIRQVQALRDEALWDRLNAADCQRTRELFVAALTRSHNLPVEGGYPTDPVTLEWAHHTMPEMTGYLIEHRDGFRTSIFLTNIRDFNYAGHLSGTGEILSCQMYLPMPGHGSTTADFFNPLTRHIEDLILTGEAPYPVQRTLLTSGMVIAGIDSLHQEQQVIKTPEMGVRYRAPEASLFWRV
ncbi:MAG: hypothetical protein O2782_20980 [bacterium]|nr:hypothetical protein [bacterium]